MTSKEGIICSGEYPLTPNIICVYIKINKDGYNTTLTPYFPTIKCILSIYQVTIMSSHLHRLPVIIRSGMSSSNLNLQ